MDELSLPHIGFQYPESYPDELILHDVTSLREHGLTVDTRKRDLGPMATIEWAIPTAIIVYLLKPYFESFLAEAGKDSYEFVKKKLVQIICEKRKHNNVLISATQSVHKLSKSYDQSHSISIHSRVSDNVRITVLFHNHLDDFSFAEAANGSIDSLLMIRDRIEKLGESENSNKVIDFYMIMNTQQKSWELLTMKQMTERYRHI